MCFCLIDDDACFCMTREIRVIEVHNKVVRYVMLSFTRSKVML